MSSYSADAAAVPSNSLESNFTLSVADLLQIVKENYPELLSKGVLAHFNISEDVQEEGVRYSLKTDSKGRKLTEAQEEYFKDSKVRDADGNLLVVYHGTGADFNEFSYDFMSTHGSMEGQGFCFTDNQSMAEGYRKDSGRVMEGYLDIRKHRLRRRSAQRSLQPLREKTAGLSTTITFRAKWTARRRMRSTASQRRWAFVCAWWTRYAAARRMRSIREAISL